MKEKKIKKKQPLREKRRRQMYSDNHEIGSFFFYGCKCLSVHDDASIWFVHGCGWMFFCCSLK